MDFTREFTINTIGQQMVVHPTVIKSEKIIIIFSIDIVVLSLIAIK